MKIHQQTPMFLLILLLQLLVRTISRQNIASHNSSQSLPQVIKLAIKLVFFPFKVDQINTPFVYLFSRSQKHFFAVETMTSFTLFNRWTKLGLLPFDYCMVPLFLFVGVLVSISGRFLYAMWSLVKNQQDPFSAFMASGLLLLLGLPTAKLEQLLILQRYSCGERDRGFEHSNSLWFFLCKMGFYCRFWTWKRSWIENGHLLRRRRTKKSGRKSGKGMEFVLNHCSLSMHSLKLPSSLNKPMISSICLQTKVCVSSHLHYLNHIRLLPSQIFLDELVYH